MLNICKIHLDSLLLTTVLLLAISQQLRAQDTAAYRIAFYNLENLFHPENDSLTNDDEFTPEGARHWTTFKYQRKLNQIAKAIIALGAWDPPTIIGLEEVENRQVVEDLIATDVLKKIPYRVVHYNSPDRRGIDCALIYRKDQFRLIDSKAFPLIIPQNANFASRDILYVKGVLRSSDTLHTLVCHWPSRYGGQAISEPKRMAAAHLVKRITDSIIASNPSAAVVIGGDFNDEPSNASLQVLCPSDSLSAGLINLMDFGHATNHGSHRHQGNWGYLDQIIVSTSLIQSTSLRILGAKAHVFREDFLLEEDLKYPGWKPYRHYLGFKLHGGFSDHLPVYIDLWQLSP